MDGILIVYTGAFIIYSVMEVLGLMPQEVKSAGITLPGLFSKYYGDPNFNFVMYQVRRSAITVMVHAFLPVLYCCGYSVLEGTSLINILEGEEILVGILWVASFSIFLCGIVIVTFWYQNGWTNHPLIIKLGKMGQPWRIVASSINMEFRDINKFVSELGSTTLVVTNSWILQCNPHIIHVVHQRDATLNVASSDEHRYILDGHSNQFITINVISLNSNFKSFDVRLNSYQYTHLRDRLLSPVRIARGVVIHQSLSDRFIVAFTEQVERNGKYTLPAGSPQLEPCIGCLQKPPEVKLQKLCNDDTENVLCRQCFCRPMWCLSCMSKWFAAKQDKYRPEEWMASHAPCPMCRAMFCMLDIQKIQSNP